MGELSGWVKIRPVNKFVSKIAISVYGVIQDFYAPLLVGENALEIEWLLEALERKSR